jgi:hypothetical protein
MIPSQEVWYGVKPSVAHLKVFGSVAYAHPYNLYDMLTKRVYVSCNVQVNEESM